MGCARDENDGGGREEQQVCSEDFDKIINDSMAYVVEATNKKNIMQVKNELEYIKNIIHHDIIRILKKNVQEFMCLPSNLNMMEKMMPLLKKEVELSKTFVHVLLKEVVHIHTNNYKLLEEKINMSFLKNVLKNNVQVEQLLIKLQKKIKMLKQNKQFLSLISMYNELHRRNFNFETKKQFLIEHLSINNFNFFFYVIEKIVILAKETWEVKALLYNNYKSICKITTSLRAWNNLLDKYGRASECSEGVILSAKNNSIKHMNECLRKIVIEIGHHLHQLSYVFLSVVKDALPVNCRNDTSSNFIMDQCLHGVVIASYLLNQMDSFIDLFREIFVDDLAHLPFESYDAFLTHVKRHLLEDERVAEINRCVDQVDPGALFCAKGIVQSLLQIIKGKFQEIFLLTHCDNFIENYTKTASFLNEIKKKKKKKYEQFIISEHVHNFLKNFEREAYAQYILNVLENKINENCKNVILFDKKYIFDDKFYWLKETINLIKIFKILFTSKYYIPSSLPNYLAFIFKHFKNYIDNVEAFLLFLRENRNAKIFGTDRTRFNWSPTLSYNSVGFILSDLISLRRIFQVGRGARALLKRGKLGESIAVEGKEINSVGVGGGASAMDGAGEETRSALPKHENNIMGDIPTWMFTKILSDCGSVYFEGEDSDVDSDVDSDGGTDEYADEYAGGDTDEYAGGDTDEYAGGDTDGYGDGNNSSREIDHASSCSSSTCYESIKDVVKQEMGTPFEKWHQWLSVEGDLCYPSKDIELATQMKNKETHEERADVHQEDNEKLDQYPHGQVHIYGNYNHGQDAITEEKIKVKDNSSTSPGSDTELHKLRKENRNIMKEKRKQMKSHLQLCKKKKKKKIENHVNCIVGFLRTISEIILNTEKAFQNFFIDKMFHICSSFLIYLHSLLVIYKMTNNRIPEKPSEQVEKILLPLISFKTFYEDIISQAIIEDIISKIVDRINDYYLQEIKNLLHIKIDEQNKRIMKLNLQDSLKDGDTPYEEKIRRQIHLDVCHYAKMCEENFKINTETSASMKALVSHLSFKE
ncbi:conserved oligomeric Golgi complex subunit 2, putative [Plasmodium knowlesi strain H]|uniref:Conserved oligomeric Golgi complex subunit 2, putative n=2 Tax=Plasmodium knowlesi TaxID=5850 RepID=B3L5B1_PLAKH|nr:conserved oligomeric Golgi complex subunit 2, putative [Plasmodium knowlesi strain H]OTN64943.1 Uncharacterized protein PKNOH_S120147300 [Plasmodium knowlesi]CAA9988330.1 conserved oligomeric Golgi complex subunit 2, putative [Plasmodium knowlesi strain H]VVS77804.1 conserved oligomeric Golgi complex subunit 2, putative [Plasmodium knowlesi strain H]|eukprot:XP_002259309.1 hypothetical protein, conserved in Plasmodium species [Plasmodium knowlesi strain H]